MISDENIQHENNWIVEPELSWERQVQREQDEIEDDPEQNSMYSLVRLFDKKKMEYFDDNYKQSHLYLSQRKFKKDCLDGNNQVKLINKVIELAILFRTTIKPRRIVKYCIGKFSSVNEL